MTETRTSTITKYTAKSTDKLYVEATQDGIVRLLKKESPECIEGLYTEGLQTCFAIVIVGENGITLIHTTHVLASTTIANEFKLMGKIAFWTLAFNPKYYPNFLENFDFQNKFELVLTVTEEVAPKKYLKNNKGNINLFLAKEGFVSVQRNGAIQVERKPTLIVEPLNPRVRFAINVVNNVFKQEEGVPGDIQFDGKIFLELPRFKSSSAEIKDIYEKKSSDTSEKAFTLHKHFCNFLKNEDTQEIDLKSCPLVIRNTTTNQRLDTRTNILNQQARSLIVHDSKPAENTSEQKDEPQSAVKFFQQKAQSLLKKYNLQNHSTASLNKGLRAAAQNNQPIDIKTFIDMGCDINAKDDNKEKGYTALHLAVLKDHLEFVQELIKYKPRLSITDAAGHTPFEYTHSDEMMSVLGTYHNNLIEEYRNYFTPF